MPLPGEKAHFKMAPAIRKAELRNHFTPTQAPKLAGVLALCYPDKEMQASFLLILRKSYPGIHADQISFPGGKKEKQDGDILSTALRETQEEVGVNPTKVEIVRALSPLYIPPSNFQVSPFLGIAHETLAFKKQESEVESLVEVPLKMLLDASFEGTTSLRTSYAAKMDVPVYNFKGHTVWGATAMMLSELRELIIKAL